MANTKTLNFDEVSVGGTLFKRHLLDSATIELSENEDAVSNNQKELSSYDLEFSVTVYDSEALHSSALFKDANQSILKRDIIFRGGANTASIKIPNVVVNMRPTYENEKTGYVLSGTKRGVSATDMAAVNPPFVINIDTTLGDGQDRMRLPAQGTNMLIDWGDGNVETVTQTATPSIANAIVHNYSTAGVYRISVSKEIERVNFADEGDNLKVVSRVANWGAAQWSTFDSAFYGCENFNPVFYDAPDLSGVISLRQMFRDTPFNQDISGWDVSGIRNFRLMFHTASSFNADISGWNMSNAEETESMLLGTLSFNHDIGRWNISSVTDMSSMLDNTGFSQENFEKTIIGWANRAETDGVQTGVALGIQGQTYSNTVHNDAYGVATGGINDAVTAINTLTSAPHNWTITGGTEV